MANIQQTSKHGAVDTDGLPVSGLHLPGTGGVWPGAMDEWTDANTDAYHSTLVSPPIASSWGGASAAFASTDTTKTATLPAGAAGTRAFLAGWYCTFRNTPGSVAALQLTIGGLPFTHAPVFLLFTTTLPFFYNTFPTPIPASALASAITLTLSNFVGGSQISAPGTIGLWGFYRTE